MARRTLRLPTVIRRSPPLRTAAAKSSLAWLILPLIITIASCDGRSSSLSSPTAAYSTTLACGACANVTGETRPVYTNCQSATADEQWRSWYAELQVCADTVGPGFDNIVWWSVDTLTAGMNGPNAAAVSCLDDIAFVPPPAEATVRHEMLHHILGVTFHPPEFARCAPG